MSSKRRSWKESEVASRIGRDGPTMEHPEPTRGDELRGTFNAVACGWSATRQRGDGYVITVRRFGRLLEVEGSLSNYSLHDRRDG
jgi:hypothetical protein